VTLDGLERCPKCHLCQLGAPQSELVETDGNGLLWCLDVVACKYRARLRLGIPRPAARELGLREIRSHAAAREEGEEEGAA